jgi:type II secretory pathway pseudopilin PulG
MARAVIMERNFKLSVRNNMQKIQRASGFTLIELLLYVGVVATLLLGVTMFLFMMLSARIKNQTLAEVHQQGAALMRIMTQSVRSAASVTTPGTGATTSTLSLVTYSAPQNPTVFDVQSGVARIKEGSALPIALTNGRVSVSGFSVQNVARTGTPGSVRIQFTITAVNPSGRSEYAFQAQFVGSASLRFP